MGLFINNNKHPDVYKNNQNLHEPNQAVARQDFLTELMKEQQKANAALKQAFSELRLRYQHQEETQVNQWNQVDNQLNDLRKNALDQKNFDSRIIQTINEKNEQLEEIIKTEALLKQTIIEKVNHLSETHQEIAERLEVNEEANQLLSVQMNEQLELQKDVVEKLTKQEEFQGDMLQRMDNQEALMEKFARQLNHIRSILFERTNYLAAKIDDGYKITSSYVYKLMTGSDQPLTFYLLNQKKEENQNQSE